MATARAKANEKQPMANNRPLIANGFANHINISTKYPAKKSNMGSKI
jgi:hypothetical protein